jgi:NO-binding membrane sensor protein with MHYT domain
MHFIGNRAVVLANSEHGVQISYNAGFTAASFFLPIAVLAPAFYFIGISERADFAYITIAGTLTGAAVCAMHYVGQLGIANYRCRYDPRYVVGAAAISVSASIAALTVFFRLRASWSNSWWKRGLSAAVLACAVSGMHWIATLGTSYWISQVALEGSGQLTSTQTVIVCAILVGECSLKKDNCKCSRSLPWQ